MGHDAARLRKPLRHHSKMTAFRVLRPVRSRFYYLFGGRIVIYRFELRMPSIGYIIAKASVCEDRLPCWRIYFVARRGGGVILSLLEYDKHGPGLR